MDEHEGAGGSLRRLLAAERRLGAVLEERRDQADRIRREARKYADSRTQELENRIAEELEGLRRDVETETERTLAEIRSRGHRGARRYERAAAEEVNRFAAMVVAAVTAPEDEEASPP
jgi:vacuolar-type H+-ATPase subunit H